MLTEITLTLQAREAATLPASHGLMANAAALNLLNRYDEALARELHDKESAKPYTVALLTGLKAQADKTLTLPANEDCRWRLTGLSKDVSACLKKITAGDDIRIGSGEFVIADIAVNSTAYSLMADKWLSMPTERLNPHIGFQINTPAAFKRGRYEYPFPAPDVVWTSLLNKWNRFSDTYCPQLLLALSEEVHLTNWHGETKRMAMGKRWSVGCVGRFNYGVSKGQDELLRLLHLLADFARFAGIGWQTTAGMGQVTPMLAPPVKR